ncbi:hypothetical protein CTEN210_18567 [Chaetoceros tenuissimus]|uniref:G-protein coupled receptors family 1 profile domain-containing protein n=1 Tax=Chaetoceros tenuissimus TaxID=426638 RepID=A0AAD3DF04_9STRA|nr:hypothetical protein CTEN210_18567 [Chaetoceros tenuissimus]
MDSLVEKERFAFTTAGVVLPSISGSLSFISSGLIMYIVLKSKQNTAYHRIMFFMSFWDALSSLSIALTTLPLPSDVIYDYSYGSYGDIQTCAVQAFTILFGTGLVLFSNILLNIYYLCTIRYGVTDAKFRLYAEPIFLFISTALSLVQPVYFATTDTLNPTPNDAYCMIGVYPEECLSNDEIECIRGDKDTFEFHQYVLSISVFAQVIILIVTMLFILHTTWFSGQQDDSSKVKTVAMQAFMYLIACLLTWVSAAIFAMVPDNKAIDAFATFFFPLQGFFNLLIFAYHKVYAYKTFNSFLLTTDIIKLLFTNPEKFKNEYVTGIENVERMHQSRNMEDMFQQNEQGPEFFRDDSGSAAKLPSGTNSTGGALEMVGSVELSVQPSSAKDIDSFLERNHDLSLGDSRP